MTLLLCSEFLEFATEDQILKIFESLTPPKGITYNNFKKWLSSPDGGEKHLMVWEDGFPCWMFTPKEIKKTILNFKK